MVEIYVDPVSGDERIKIVSELLKGGDIAKDSGRYMALRALSDSDTAKIIAARINNKVVGVMSYRFDDRGIKRISAGSLVSGIGIGSAMVRWLANTYPGLPMWCKSVKSANGWCEKLGMVRTGVEFPELNAFEYLWKPESISKWMNK